jgi:hypothetical protein
MFGDGDLENVTELQYNAIPFIVVTWSALQNGKWQEQSSSDNVTYTIEEYTAMRTTGKVPSRSSLPYKTEPVPEGTTWKSVRPILKDE